MSYKKKKTRKNFKLIYTLKKIFWATLARKTYFPFVFIKLLLPIRNKYIMSYKKKNAKKFQVNIHLKESLL